MGKKYIIELLDDCPSEFKGIMVFGLTQEKQISVELIPEESLRPYTEPDLDAIRNETWEAARKIWTSDIYLRVFKVTMRMDCLTKFSASEAIEKIRQYEQEKEEQIQVGDEVNAPFGKAVVVNIDLFAKKIWIVYADGHGGFVYFKNTPTKTGRHFPEIAEAMRKMREE